MLIEEIIRSCSNPKVAHAAVASIGSEFSTEIASAAAVYGIDVGSFVVMSVDRFSRHGDEGELRSVLAAMNAAQEPVLAGLHRILCIALAAGVPARGKKCRRFLCASSRALRDGSGHVSRALRLKALADPTYLKAAVPELKRYELGVYPDMHERSDGAERSYSLFGEIRRNDGRHRPRSTRSLR